MKKKKKKKKNQPICLSIEELVKLIMVKSYNKILSAINRNLPKSI